MKELKGKKVESVRWSSPEEEYISRTLMECRTKIPAAVRVARKERSEPSLAAVCDLSRSLYFAYEAHGETPELRDEVKRLFEMCVDVTKEVVGVGKLQGDELGHAKPYVLQNEKRLRWATAASAPSVRQEKSASLGLACVPA